MFARLMFNILPTIMGVLDVRVLWHTCDVGDCDFRSKHATNLKQHKANVHNVGVVWLNCNVGDCDYRSKQTNNLKRHKASVHDVGVVWYECRMSVTATTGPSSPAV